MYYAGGGNNDAVLTPIPVKAGGVMFNDKNFNGVKDAGEAGIAGAAVTATGGDLAAPATATTDANGAYEFANLNGGDYNVAFAAPSGYRFTTPSSQDFALLSGVDVSDLNAGLNAAPNASGDSYNFHGTLVVDAASGVLANDADPEGNALSAQLVNNAAHGSVTFNADGSFTYIPNADFSGSDSFTYRTADSLGGGSPVTVTLNGTNSAPWAMVYAAPSNQVHAGQSLGLTVTTGDPDNDAVTVQFATPAYGSVSFSNGTFTYHAPGSIVGTSLTVTLSSTATDGHGGTFNGTFDVSVTNTPPMGSLGSTPGVHAGNAITIAPYLYDTDGDTVTIIAVGTPNIGSVSFTGTTLIYTAPNNVPYSTTATFTYTLSDGRGATAIMTATVNVTNMAPIPYLTSWWISTAYNTPVSFGWMDGDSDGDAVTMLSYEVTSGQGTLTESGGTFTPANGFYGQVQFTFTVIDSHGAVGYGYGTLDVMMPMP